MEKFKIGDLVRRIYNPIPEIKVGDILKVVDIGNSKSCGGGWKGWLALSGKNNNQIGYDPDCFEIVGEEDVGFKIGDKVRRKNGCFSSIKEGDIVTISSIKKDSTGSIGGFLIRERPDIWFDSRNFDKVEENQSFEIRDNVTLFFKVDSNKTIVKEETKMEKPTTELEKNACKLAIKEAIDVETRRKAEEYKRGMVDFIRNETEARKYRKMADTIAETLGLTKEQIKELF